MYKLIELTPVSVQGYNDATHITFRTKHPSRQADRQRYPHSIKKQFNRVNPYLMDSAFGQTVSVPAI